MRRPFLALIAAGIVALGACGGDGGDPSETAAAADDAVLAAADCDALMTASQPVFVGLFQGLVDDAAALGKEDLAALADEAADSDLVKDFLARAERDVSTLEQRGRELGCTESQARAAVCGAVASVEAQDSVVAETILADMAGECP